MCLHISLFRRAVILGVVCRIHDVAFLIMYLVHTQGVEGNGTICTQGHTTIIKPPLPPKPEEIQLEIEGETSNLGHAVTLKFVWNTPDTRCA